MCASFANHYNVTQMYLRIQNLERVILNNHSQMYLILHVDEVLRVPYLLDVALGDGGVDEPALLAVHQLGAVLVEDGGVGGD